MKKLNVSVIDDSWKPSVFSALKKMNPHYLATLEQKTHWLPGPESIFNAFSLPLEKTRFILFGESPYPRADSANGYAFWDDHVINLWSPNGFDTRVNRATSLRNMLKAILVAEGTLSLDDLSQDAIAKIDKSHYVKTAQALFLNFMKRGILLLNASLVLSERPVKEDARAWQPFIENLLENLKNKKITLILFGKIAEAILALPSAKQFEKIVTEHPYNLSFIHNNEILKLFKSLQLLDS